MKSEQTPKVIKRNIEDFEDSIDESVSENENNHTEVKAATNGKNKKQIDDEAKAHEQLN